MVSTILRNLVSNALKFSYENTEVSLYFMDEDDSIRIIVKDNGVGISEEKKEYVNKHKNGFDINSDADRRSAYNKAVKLLEEYSLLGDFGGDLRNTIYFKNTLKSNQESLIIKYYENYIRDSIISALTYDGDIKGLYAEKYNAQKEKYNS
jgi:hypothetical protein